MTEGVLNCLAASINENKTIREQAEQQLSQLFQQPGFGIILSQILVDNNILIDYRQLAGILLKRFVRNHWEPPLNSKAIRVPDNDREAIRRILPQALQAPQVKIRTAAAMAIASIAHWDWPTQWPDLVQNLLGCLSNPNSHLVEGAICCLEIIASGDNSSEQYLPGLITQTFPPLLQIITDTSNKFDDRIKMRATMVFYSCLDWLSTTKLVLYNIVDTISPMIPHWVDAFYCHLSVMEHPMQYKGLKIAILQTMLIMIHHFPSYVKKDIEKLLEPIWMALVSAYQVYEEAAIKSDRLNEINLREGESPSTVGLEPFVAILFDVFHALAYKKKFRPFLLNKLPHLFYLTIGYMQMTEEQIENYNSDPNQWVADEDDDTLEFSVRISTTKLIQELFHSFKAEAHNPFSLAITKRIQESDEIMKRGDNVWWKLREASVYAIGIVTDDLIKNPKAFDLKGFCHTILLNDIKLDLPFLKGRALWCASTIGGTFLSLEELTPFLAVASNTLNSPTDPIPVKIFACRAVSNLCPRLQKNIAVPYIDGLMGGLVNIMEHLSKETLYLLLETFHVLLRLSEDVSIKYLVPIVSRLLVLWAHNYKDLTLVQHIVDIITDLALFPNCNMILQEKLSKTLINFLRHHDKHQFCVIETTIDIITSIIMPGKGVIHPLLMNELFPILCNLLISTEDQYILEGGSNCLRAYIRNGGNLLLEWKNPITGENGLQMIMKVITRLLGPGIPEMAAINVGFLIDKLVTTYKEHIGSILDDLLTRVLQRIHTVNDSTLKQGFLIVFVRLFVMDTEQAIAYLLSKNQGGLSELSFILREWTVQHQDFGGPFKIKMSIIGLSKLFQSSNIALSNITVPGDLLPSSDNKPMTRSKVKHQIADESLKFRIFKILIREYDVILENEQESLSLSDSLEETEWDSNNEEEDINFTQLEKSDPDITESLSDPFVSQTTYAYLSDIGNMVEREEKDDPDIQSDPIYNINLKQFITQFFNAFTTQDKNTFLHLASALPQLDQTVLKKIIKF